MDVSRLADLVSYQEGSVVSRTLIKKKTGSVTLFAFDEGESLSEHTVPHEALLFVLEGEAEVRIAGTAHGVAAGEMVILPADVPHAVRSPERFKMLLTMIRE